VVVGEEEEEEEAPQAPLKGSVVQGEDVEEDETPVEPEKERNVDKDGKKTSSQEEKVPGSQEEEIQSFSIEGKPPVAEKTSIQPKSVLGRKIVERNENIRKVIGTKLFALYYQTNQNLKTTSINLGNTLNSMQDTSHHLCEVNDDLVSLSTKLPASGIWVDSFLSGMAAST
jgi:hypothetical protein